METPHSSETPQTDQPEAMPLGPALGKSKAPRKTIEKLYHTALVLAGAGLLIAAVFTAWWQAGVAVSSTRHVYFPGHSYLEDIGMIFDDRSSDYGEVILRNYDWFEKYITVQTHIEPLYEAEKNSPRYSGLEYQITLQGQRVPLAKTGMAVGVLCAIVVIVGLSRGPAGYWAHFGKALMVLVVLALAIYQVDFIANAPRADTGDSTDSESAIKCGIQRGPLFALAGSVGVLGGLAGSLTRLPKRPEDNENDQPEKTN